MDPAFLPLVITETTMDEGRDAIITRVFLCVSPGPLLGSLNWNQKVASLGSSSARHRRFIEEAELFNIEVCVHQTV